MAGVVSIAVSDALGCNLEQVNVRTSLTLTQLRAVLYNLEPDGYELKEGVREVTIHTIGQLLDSLTEIEDGDDDEDDET